LSGAREGGARPGQRALLVAGVAVAAAAFAVALRPLADWDAFHHLAYGRDVLRRGGFAPEDPFLYPLAGRPSGPQPSWLGSVALYAAWLAAGDVGPVLLTAVVAAATFTIVLADAAEGWDATLTDLAGALVPVALALAAWRGRAVPRPEAFANLLLAALLLALRRSGQSRAAALAAAPALLLWANLHQSVLAGVFALAAFAGVHGVLHATGRGARAEAPPRAVLTVAGAALAGALLCALTPVGLAPFVTPVRVVLQWAAGAPAAQAGDGDAVPVLQGLILELRPWRPTALDPLAWLLALATAAFAAASWRERRLALREAVTAVAFAALAVRAVRFGPMAALVVAPFAARSLRAALRGWPARLGRVARAGLGAAALAVAAAPWAAALAAPRGFASAPPARAAAYLRDAGFRGRLFDTFHFGGYLEWTLDVPVYQDGRGGLLPEEARAALRGPTDRAAFAALDARWRFDALVVEIPTLDAGAAAALARASPDDDWLADRRTWALVAFDDGGLLYLRRDGALAARAARDAYALARPAASPGLEGGDPAALRAEYERSVREAPGCATCLAHLGYVLLREGRAAEAEPPLADAARRGPPLVRAQALYGLATAAAMRGKPGQAAERMREVVESVADPREPRRHLASLLASSGRAREAVDELRRNLRTGRHPADAELARSIARTAADPALAGEVERDFGAAR
jgi:hypothetical protein